MHYSLSHTVRPNPVIRPYVAAKEARHRATSQNSGFYKNRTGSCWGELRTKQQLGGQDAFVSDVKLFLRIKYLFFYKLQNYSGAGLSKSRKYFLKNSGLEHSGHSGIRNRNLKIHSHALAASDSLAFLDYLATICNEASFNVRDTPKQTNKKSQVKSS